MPMFRCIFCRFKESGEIRIHKERKDLDFLKISWIHRILKLEHVDLKREHMDSQRKSYIREDVDSCDCISGNHGFIGFGYGSMDS